MESVLLPARHGDRNAVTIMIGQAFADNSAPVTAGQGYASKTAAFPLGVDAVTVLPLSPQDLDKSAAIHLVEGGGAAAAA